MGEQMKTESQKAAKLIDQQKAERVKDANAMYNQISELQRKAREQQVKSDEAKSAAAKKIASLTKKSESINATLQKTVSEYHKEQDKVQKAEAFMQNEENELEAANDKIMKERNATAKVVHLEKMIE